MTETLCNFGAQRKLVRLSRHVSNMERLSFDQCATGKRTAVDGQHVDVIDRLCRRSFRRQVTQSIAFGQVHRGR